jgi:hypothetical protein
MFLALGIKTPLVDILDTVRLSSVSKQHHFGSPFCSLRQMIACTYKESYLLVPHGKASLRPWTEKVLLGKMYYFPQMIFVVNKYVLCRIIIPFLVSHRRSSFADS